jgi:hypothetical protein
MSLDALAIGLAYSAVAHHQQQLHNPSNKNMVYYASNLQILLASKTFPSQKYYDRPRKRNAAQKR